MHLGSNIQTQMHGTVFTAVSTTITDRTNKELAQEQIPSIGKSAKTQKSEQLSYETTAPLEDSTLVAFKDPTNDKYVMLSLKDSTIDALKSHFGKDDFYKRDDGTIRLDNKAESYVAGWFGDIAYKRGFLKADSDGDGKLSDGEYNQTRNDFAGHGMVGTGRVDEYVDKNYVKNSENDSVIVRYNNKSYQQPQNIDEELDTTLRINSDYNGNISLRESYNTNKNNTSLSTHKLIEKHVNEAMHLGLLDEDLVLKLLEEQTKESQKQLEALQKLKMAKGDISTLNKSELKALDGLIPSDTKNISDETIDKISKSIQDQMKIKEAYKNQDNESASKIMTLKG